MKKAIVSGANGFIGSAVIKYLISQNVEVLALYHGNNDINIPHSHLIKKLSIEVNSMDNLINIISANEYDTFYDFIWQGINGQARSSVQIQLQNVQYTLDLLQLAHKLGCKRFVCSGSIMELEAIEACYTQGNHPGMGYVYGAGKVAAHIMCMSMATKLRIDLIWGELTNAYGIGEISPRLINSTIRKCIKNEEPRFTLAKQNYDFVYIDDVARAFYLIGKKGKPFHRYLIGSSTARPLKEFLLEMKKIVAPNLNFIFGAIPFTGINLSLEKFDCTPIERDTGFKAEISFPTGIKRTIKWLKEISK